MWRSAALFHSQEAVTENLISDGWKAGVSDNNDEV